MEILLADKLLVASSLFLIPEGGEQLSIRLPRDCKDSDAQDVEVFSYAGHQHLETKSARDGMLKFNLNTDFPKESGVRLQLNNGRNVVLLKQS